MPAKYQYFDCVKRMQTSKEKSAFEQKSQEVW